jgi:hypothetical protein
MKGGELNMTYTIHIESVNGKMTQEFEANTDREAKSKALEIALKKSAYDPTLEFTVADPNGKVINA